MSLFELVAILLVLTAAFCWINQRLGWLPHTIGLLAVGFGASLVTVVAEWAVPGLVRHEDVAALVRKVDF